MIMSSAAKKSVYVIILGVVMGFAFIVSCADAQEPAAGDTKEPAADSEAMLDLGMDDIQLDPNVAKRPLIRIGVLAKGRVADCAIRYKSTADYLTSKIDDYRFVIVPIRFDGFVETVKNEKFDFIVCNPMLYVELQVQGKAMVIATMEERFEGMTFSKYGGVIFCRKDREDLQDIEDIRGKSFAAVSENSFGGWVAGEAFLLSKGIDPREDASEFVFLETHSEVVREVTNGIYDVGTVRTGTLERMAKSGVIDMDDYRIFHASPPTSDFPFYTSTKLYPDWVFAKTDLTNDTLANKVAMLLYAMPERSKAARRGNYAGWVMPANYQSVWECIENVRDPRFAQKYGTFRQFLGTYGVFIVAVIGLIVALSYILSLQRKLTAVNSLMDRHTEDIAEKEQTIQDLKQRIVLIADGENEDINIIRSDYRIEYLTPEWEATYGPGVGQHCYEYFADRDSPCEKCGLREALQSQEVRTIQKPFPRESGRALEVTTIPLAKSSDGVQRFGQTYCDVQMRTRQATFLTTSQEKETNYALLQGVLSQSTRYPGQAKEFLRKACDLVSDGTPTQKVLDVNELVQETVELTAHVWESVGEVSFDLASEQPKVWASERDMKTVIANLILNAVRCLERTTFSSMHKGMISFSTRLQGGSVFLMVMDNGDAHNFMAVKELSAKPGHDEAGPDKFTKMGLFPAYDRVLEKWNAKLRIHCTEENRMIRTVVMHAVTGDQIVPLVTGEMNAADAMTPSHSSS